MKKQFVRNILIFNLIFVLSFSCGSNKQERLYKHLSSAREKIHLHDFSGAMEELEKAEKINRSNPEIYFLRANIQMTFREYDAAMENFNKAIELDENYMDAYVNRGKLWFYLGDSDKRCEDYLKAESLGATNLYEDTKFCR